MSIQQVSIPVTIRDAVNHKLPLCRGKNKQMLLGGFVAYPSAPLKTKPGICREDHGGAGVKFTLTAALQVCPFDCEIPPLRCHDSLPLVR